MGLKLVGLTEFNGTNAVSETIHMGVYGVMVLTLQRSAEELNAFQVFSSSVLHFYPDRAVTLIFHNCSFP